MATGLVDIGEEYISKFGASGETFAVGLYDDSSDQISDANDLSSVNSEPSTGNYSQQSGVAFTVSDISGDWGPDNDNQISFDVTDTTEFVDSYYLAKHFTSDDTGDTGTSGSDHLIATGSLSSSRNLSGIDTLNVNAAGVGFTLD